ncbi:MAG: hypothetical protein U9O98_04780, partial [Asgard group archaeon]|nr:hypothetical protein [Asgard group archaeon]
MRDVGEVADSPIAITARQLESLIRLTESHARMALRKEASIEDADAAIRLLRESLKQVGIDPETGRMDIDTIMVGTSSSTRSKIEALMELISDLEEKGKGEAVSIPKVVEEAENLGMQKDFIERNIERMRQDGILFQPKAGFIKRT